MALWDRVTTALALRRVEEPGPVLDHKRFPHLYPADMAQRDLASFEFLPLSDQIAALRRAQLSPWRPQSIRQAMSHPAIFRAVTMISNTVGTLTFQAYKRGQRMADDERPPVVVRPNPLTTPREFHRQTAWDMATAGEAWLWDAVVDPDTGGALSVVPVPPREVMVEEDPNDPRYPIIRWRNRVMDPAHFHQVVLTRESGALRGSGPLQWCGAAVSIAVEAQEWAANFYAGGGYPSIIIRSAVPLGVEDPEDPDALTEAELMAAEWMNKPHNLPRVIDPRIEEVQEVAGNNQGSQMLGAREYSNGDAARMFGIPGSLLDHNTPGASITYQNVGSEYDKWVRMGLAPDYLEPIEQQFSDLLKRQVIVRYNTKALLRADIKTRFDVHKIAIDSQIYGPEQAAAEEGYQAGDVEYAPVPPSPPSATPPIVIERARPEPKEVRCQGRVVRRGLLADCGRLLGKVAAPYEIKCPQCNTMAVAPA